MTFVWKRSRLWSIDILPIPLTGHFVPFFAYNNWFQISCDSAPRRPMSQSEIKNLLTKNVFPTKIFSKIFCYSLKERKKKKGKKKAKLSRKQHWANCELDFKIASPCPSKLLCYMYLDNSQARGYFTYNVSLKKKGFLTWSQFYLGAIFQSILIGFYYGYFQFFSDKILAEKNWKYP